MTTALGRARSAAHDASLPKGIYHPSFSLPSAERLLGSDPIDDGRTSRVGYMPDDVTRDRARRMHYAAHRARTASTRRGRQRWLDQYYRLRDSIVLGNMKLIFRAVRRSAAAQRADDSIGECQIVLIQAVAAYNPWFGVRFSTYAYTCLARALSRMAHRLAGDRLARALTLDAGMDVGDCTEVESGSTSGAPRIEEFLRPGHPLLTGREKQIISRRYFAGDSLPVPTLEMVGRDLGLSKERVRQVQAEAFSKLRQALTC